MKKEVLLAGLIAILCIGIVNACIINVSMINQDPYPAIPGESVKVIFQIDGVSDPGCGVVNFRVNEGFPLTIDPSSENPISITSGTYTNKYRSFYLAPYKIRIDKDAIEGDNPLEITYSISSQTEISQEFNIYVKDTKADFEVHVKDYDTTTKTMTLEILNIEDVDIRALTIEIPKQDNIDIKGANRIVIGDLDSNEYTSVDFEGIAKDGEIDFKLIYTDSADIRREINKTILFDSSYFNGLNRNKSNSYWVYILILILIVGFFVWRFYRKKRMKKKMHHR